MSNYYPVTYQAACPQPENESACSSLIRLAVMGGVIGGAVAAGNNINKLRDGRVNISAIATNIGRGAVSGAVATSVAGAAAGIVAEHGLTRLGVMFVAGTAAIYMIESASSKKSKIKS